MVRLRGAWLAAACTAAATLVAAAARGEETDTGAWRYGGELELTAGFKPEFYEEDGDGRYQSLSLGLTAARGATLGVTLTQGVLAVETPERKVEATDPILAATARDKLEALGVGVSIGASASPALSKESRAAESRGSAKLTGSVSKKLGDASVGAGVSASRKFYRYTLAVSGAPNPRLTTSGFLFGGYQLTQALSVSVNLAYLRTQLYAGADRYYYSNSAGASYAVTDDVGLGIGISTSDSQLSPAGDDNNELTLYKRNKTEMEVSATCAF